jgi:small subunit ribosomal protein S25e
MPPKQQKSKEAKSAAAKSGGSAKKKKWSKGKTREELDNAVLWEKSIIQKLEQDVPKYKVITPAIVSDRLKITVSLADLGLKHLLAKKSIKLVSASSKLRVYTRNVVAEEAAAAAAPTA